MWAIIILAFVFINLIPITTLSALALGKPTYAAEILTKERVEEKEEPQKQPPEEPQKELEKADIPIEEQNGSDLTTEDTEQREELSNQLSLPMEEPITPIHNRQDFKSWTDYRALGRSTPNYKLCYAAASNTDESDNTGIDENGLLVYEGYYLVALGSGWSDKKLEVGDKFIVYTEDGKEIPVMICDEKADRDTDSATHKYTVSNGCIVEFYVDRNRLNKDVRNRGTVGILPEFSGKVLTVIPIEGGK